MNMNGVCMIVLKGILCIKTCNIHPGRRKDVVFLRMLVIATLKLLVIFRALCQGILFGGKWFFCEKATIDFRRMLCEVSSVCHLQTQWNGDGCHFSRFHSLYSTNIERKGTKRVQTKKESAPANQKKIKVNFVLGILAQDSRNPNHQWLRQISMKLPFAVLRKSALKFTKGSKRENSISYHFLLFWFHQNLISSTKNSAIMLEWEDSLKSR